LQEKVFSIKRVIIIIITIIISCSSSSGLMLVPFSNAYSYSPVNLPEIWAEPGPVMAAIEPYYVNIMQYF